MNYIGYYFSIEFLRSRSLSNNLHNLGITEVYREALAEMGVDLGAIEDRESDAGLGKGGLGRSSEMKQSKGFLILLSRVRVSAGAPVISRSYVF